MKFFLHENRTGRFGVRTEGDTWWIDDIINAHFTAFYWSKNNLREDLHKILLIGGHVTAMLRRHGVLYYRLKRVFRRSFSHCWPIRMKLPNARDLLLHIYVSRSLEYSLVGSVSPRSVHGRLQAKQKRLRFFVVKYTITQLYNGSLRCQWQCPGYSSYSAVMKHSGSF